MKSVRFRSLNNRDIFGGSRKQRDGKIRIPPPLLCRSLVLNPRSWPRDDWQLAVRGESCPASVCVWVRACVQRAVDRYDRLTSTCYWEGVCSPALPVITRAARGHGAAP